MATAKLEGLLSDGKKLMSTLDEMNQRLINKQALDLKDFHTIDGAEAWLNTTHSIHFVMHTSNGSPDVTLRTLKLCGTDHCTTPTMPNVCMFDAHVQNSMSIDFAQGLDEAHDFDWDCEGIELILPPTKYLLPLNPANTDTNCELSPLDTAGNVMSDSCQECVSTIKRCPSYLGLYEEAMEMTLELEEEFYSDEEDLSEVSEKIARDAHRQELFDADELTISTDVQHNYRLVNIEDDMISLSSSHRSINSPAHRLKHCSDKYEYFSTFGFHKRSPQVTPSLYRRPISKPSDKLSTYYL